MRSGLLGLFPVLPALFLMGCALPYYTQAVRGQIGLLRQRVPIEEVIADPEIADATKERLRLVTELRQFAVSRIGLPENDSYSSFVALERDFVVWNVVAAEEFSVTPLTWCFPVAGCVAYRGYFDRAKAEKFAANLQSKGYDTFIGGAVAYSTLGHFADPVLDTMLGRGDTELAATLFHELAHQRFYVKDDTELSESFATAVEQYAVDVWLMDRNQAAAATAYQSHLARQDEFAALVVLQRRRMAEIFAADAAEEGLRRAKAEAYAAMYRDYEFLRQTWGNAADFDGWFAGEFNNARLAALSSYRRFVPGLRTRLEVLGPEGFYLEFEALLELAPELRDEQLESWNAASAVAALPDRGELVDTRAQAGTDNGLHGFRHDPEGGESVLAANARDGE
jgi:predicted aminopeptidase